MLFEIAKVVRLLQVMPAANAVSERSFSAVRCIKKHLCSTMLQEWLNAVIGLHVHKDLTDGLDLKSISNKFACKLDLQNFNFPLY